MTDVDAGDYPKPALDGLTAALMSAGQALYDGASDAASSPTKTDGNVVDAEYEEVTGR